MPTMIEETSATATHIATQPAPHTLGVPWSVLLATVRKIATVVCSANQKGPQTSQQLLGLLLPCTTAAWAAWMTSSKRRMSRRGPWFDSPHLPVLGGYHRQQSSTATNQFTLTPAEKITNTYTNHNRRFGLKIAFIHFRLKLCVRGLAP